MTTRLLPPEEWHKLQGYYLGSVLEHFDPMSVAILVVEDGSRIVAHWAMLSMLHVEGLWVDPKAKSRASVLLWRGMQRLVQAQKASSVITGCLSDEVRNMLQRKGAVELPSQFALPMGVN